MTAAPAGPGITAGTLHSIQGFLCFLSPGEGKVTGAGPPTPGTTHALLLPQWSEDVCAAHLTQRDGYQATTQGQLKERLYQEINHYFDKGMVKKKKKSSFSVVFFFCVHLPAML